MMNKSGLNILMFCNRPQVKGDASTIIDHIDAFVNYSTHNIFLYSKIGLYPEDLDLNRFDALIIHYSVSLFGSVYLADRAKKAIKKFKGLKIVFIQDEYRRINAVCKELANLEIDILYTCVPSEEIEKVYPAALFPRLKKINNLTGYIPENLLKHAIMPLEDRSIDVGYRARKVPFWLGTLGAEKYQISDGFYKHTKHEKLNLDLSYNEKKRLYGDDWIKFISSCRTMLGVESGASVFDFSGEIEKKVESYQLWHPFASFEKNRDLFLKEHENKISLNQISPRCFEAIALKTVLILYEGNYSGILKPWQHYIPLKKDFSNIKTVVEFVRSNSQLQVMAETAYQEIALNPLYSYKNFINRFDEVVESEFILQKKMKVQHPYNASCFIKDSNSFVFYKDSPTKIRMLLRFFYKPLPCIVKKYINHIYFSLLEKKSI